MTNYKYYISDTEEEANIYEIYSREIIIYNKIFEKILLYELIIRELKLKYRRRIMEAFDNYKKSMFKLGSEISAKYLL